jgi:hypothetical protein
MSIDLIYLRDIGLNVVGIADAERSECKATFESPHHGAPASLPKPPGLFLAHAKPGTVAKALDELKPYLPDRYQNQIELQWSFGMLVGEGRFTIEHPVEDFPETVKLMEECMRELDCRADLLDQCKGLNVIVRRYFPKNRITFHVDKEEWFGEQVFGCVLYNHASHGLQFCRLHDNPAESPPTYMVPECVGLAMLQTGESRHDFKHGIPKIDGERLSVTWRWFSDEHIATMKAKRLVDPKFEHLVA